MITQEIRKPLRSVRDIVASNVHRIFPTIKDIPVVVGRIMGKQEFIDYIEEVKKRFPKGTLVTLRSLPYFPNRCPTNIWKVTDIQELRHEASVDLSYNEPRCVYVGRLDSEFGTGAMCPNQLRPLTEQELNIVDTRNKAVEALRKLAVSNDPDPTVDTGDYAG